MAFIEPKRRRISAARQGELISQMTAQQAQTQNQQLLDEIVTELKARPEMLLAVKAGLAKGVESTEAGKLKKGVRFLTGPQTACVPWYVVKQLIVRISGLDPGSVEGLPDAKVVCRNLMVYGIGANDRHPVPDKEMELQAFYAWYMDKYQQLNLRLQGVDLSRPLNWNTGLGYFVLESESGFYNKVRHMPSGLSQPLPPSVAFPVADLGRVWNILNNHIEGAANLKQVQGISLTLADMFPNEVGKDGAKVTVVPSQPPVPIAAPSTAGEGEVEAEAPEHEAVVVGDAAAADGAFETPPRVRRPEAATAVASSDIPPPPPAPVGCGVPAEVAPPLE